MLGRGETVNTWHTYVCYHKGPAEHVESTLSIICLLIADIFILIAHFIWPLLVAI